MLYITLVTFILNEKIFNFAKQQKRDTIVLLWNLKHYLSLVLVTVWKQKVFRKILSNEIWTRLLQNEHIF